jgi:hypothetical protein
MIVSTERDSNKNTDDDAIVVRTPLDAIMRLEKRPQRIRTVVLSGSYASNDELVKFIREAYPWVASSTIYSCSGVIATSG